MHLTPSSLLEASIVLASMMAGNSMPSHSGIDANAVQRYCQLYQSTCQNVCRGVGSEIQVNHCWLKVPPPSPVGRPLPQTLEDQCECQATANLQQVDQEAEVYRLIGNPTDNGVYPGHKNVHKTVQITN